MDDAEGRMWWYRALHAHLLDALDGVSGMVLDAGCGTGGFLAALGHRNPALRRVGVEFDSWAAERARRKSGAMVLRGSVNTLPLAEASCDAAVAADVLCHAAVQPDTALAELRRALRPGGRLVINMPAYRWLLSAHDARVHNTRRQAARETAAMLRDAGFVQVRARYWNGVLLPLMVVQRKLIARGGARSDVAPFPPWLNVTLRGITELERRLALRLPAGGSVLATAEKP